MVGLGEYLTRSKIALACFKKAINVSLKPTNSQPEMARGLRS